MPRYAAVDIGSNSVRMMVADVTSAGTAILAQDRQVTRLGSSVFQEGRISASALQFLCEQLTRMAATFRGFQVSAIRAVATSAVRDAANQDEFRARTQAALGVPVEIISGEEEARLIFLGVQQRWPDNNERMLIVDIGGGSTEFLLNDRGTFLEPFSRPLGAVRLTEVFLKSDPPTDLELRQMNEFIAEKLAGPRENIHGPFDRGVGTSSTAAALVCAANGIPRPQREEADRLHSTTSQVRALYQRLSAMDLAARRGVTGIGPRRAELIVAGSAVLLQSMEAFGLESIAYSMAGVRDGIIADLAARGEGRALSRLDAEQRRVVEEMAQRYGVKPGHARKVGSLALHLFDAFQPLHKLPPIYGKLIEAAGYLHDVGHFVSNSAHHKHSLYLVSNSPMPGFTDAERQCIAVLCRYHRRTAPGPKHPFFETVTSSERRPVILLTPLLRLADSLDRGHQQNVRDITVKLENRQAVIELEASRNTDLELWAADRIADLFRATYEIALTVRNK
jgi:exopolyphosphatase/guanosine-5'-triphosphate,3'-diphosphate pyrophosphatase